jgi:hypothetical protein
MDDDFERAYADAYPNRLPAYVRERDVEGYLIKRVAELGGETRKVGWLGRAGAPDRLVLLPAGRRRQVGDRTVIDAYGCHFFVEVKRPGKGAEPQQEREHARLRAAGVKVYVLDTKAKVDEVLG